MDGKAEKLSNAAIIDVQQQDDDKNSVTSEENLLADVDDQTADKEARNNFKSKINGSEKFKTVDKNSEEGLDQRNESFESENIRNGTDFDIELKPIKDDVDENEASFEGSRKKSKKESNKKKKKKKNSVEDLTVAVVVNNNVVPNLVDMVEDGKKNGENEIDDRSENIPNDVQQYSTKSKTDKNTNGKDSQNVTNGSKKMEGALNEQINKNNEEKNMDEIAVVGSDELDGFTKVMGNEELDHDALSNFSFKEQKDFKYYFQHPYLRLFISYLVVFCNFLIYAEDPVAHSVNECNIPLVGNDFAFVFTRYPPNAWSLLKVFLWLAAIVTGMLVGKLVVHKLFLSKLLRLKMFSEDQGSWMVMFLFSLLTVFIFSWIYDAFLLAGGSSMEKYAISGLMGLSNSIFMKMAACGTWCGDFFTAWMVTDMMLQEKLYPYWARPVRRWWNRKYHRIIMFWTVMFLTSFAVAFTISTDYIQWDKLHRDFLSSNELSRAFLASFILVMDILIVVQDWDFPHFISAIDIKLPGIDTAHIKFDIPNFCRPEKWHIHITGKWFNYGILFFVMILDLNMWKNQIFYAPFDYGQYTDSNGKIHTVKDDYSLENFNETLMSFSYRNSTINPLTNQTYISEDSVMNSRYYNYSLPAKAIAFIPAIAAFITFALLIWNFGRFKPSKQDPYAGRLLKRPKKEKKSSFRLFRESMHKRFSIRKRVKAVPKLIAFTRRNHTKSDLPENWRPPTEPA